MSLADDHDVNVRIYHRDGTIFADTRTGAPEALLNLLDSLGFERREAPGEVWHQLPESMDEIAMHDTLELAAGLATMTGLRMEIDPGIVGGTAYQEAVAATKPPAADATNRRTSHAR
ncbi:hypothetical protein J5J01_00305 [Streptomyces fradiae]|uniref:hypothetical protein n=1 Tax=Streptomyces fradiae TaxID=1906 RepID=UPI002018B736|nr:hypothetical protein [Streptomyces fradiae]UQS30282.1 hypothetical protein J5J01_00305 [Streptomyces fradiae]